MSVRKAKPDDLIKVLTLDRPSDLEELKLMAAELDNDTGRSIYTAIFEGSNTVSEIAERVGISIQLASYHVEKLLMAGLIEELSDIVWVSQKGKRVAHYMPSRSAVLIVPSIDSLRKEGEEMVKGAFWSVIKRLFGSLAIGAVSFLALNRITVALYSIYVERSGLPATNLKTGTGGEFGIYSTSNAVHSVVNAIFSNVMTASLLGAPFLVPLIYSIVVPVMGGAAIAYFIFKWSGRRH